MKAITIRAGNITMSAELNDKPTAVKVWEALPIEGRGSRWGDEIYFEIPVSAYPTPASASFVTYAAQVGLLVGL